MKISVSGIPTHEVDRIRAGGPDAHGQQALVRIAEGAANPCRHCLELIREGDEKLVLAYRPFADLQPYAEVGPIFLHPKACAQYDGTGVPGWFAFMDSAIRRSPTSTSGRNSTAFNVASVGMPRDIRPRRESGTR